MNEPKDGGPAYPQPCTELGYASKSPYGIAGGGISVRDYFAAKALIGIFQSTRMMEAICRSDADEIPTQISKAAFDVANAMLAARQPNP